MKARNLRSVLVTLTGSVLCTAGLVQAQNSLDYQGSTTSTPRMERMEKITAATVNDTAGQAIGRIQDVVADTTTGALRLGIISLDNLGRPNQYTAVPWQLLRPTGPNTFVFTGDRNTLQTADTFPAGNWPNFSNPTYTAQVYSHYGLNAPAVAATATGAPVLAPTGVQTGTGYYQGYYEQRLWYRPQPDGKMVFPQLVHPDQP